MKLTCEICGHSWTPVPTGKKETVAKLVKKSKQAAAVNSAGPFCELCRTLIMACRVAKARNYPNLTSAVGIRMAFPKFVEQVE